MRTDYTAINARTISVAGAPIAGSGNPGAGSYTTFDQLDADVVLYLNGSLIQGSPYPGMVITNFNDINVLSGVGLANIVKYGAYSSPVTNSATGPLNAVGGYIPPIPPVPTIPFEPMYAAFTQPTDTTVFYPWPDQTLKQYMNANLTTGVQKSSNTLYCYKFAVTDDGRGWSGDSTVSTTHQRAEFGGYSAFGHELWESWTDRTTLTNMTANEQSYLVLKQVQHVPDGNVYGPPPISLNLRNDGLHLATTYYGTYENPIVHWVNQDFGPFPYALGQPHNIVWHVINGPTGNGTIELWIDGTKYVDQVGNASVGYPDSAANNLFAKEGVYLYNIATGSGKSVTHEIWNLEQTSSPLISRVYNPLPILADTTPGVLGPTAATAAYGAVNTIQITGLNAGETLSSAAGGTISGTSLIIQPMAAFSPKITTSAGRTLTISVTVPLPGHQLLADFETLSGTSASTSAASFALDTTARLVGTTSLAYTGKSTGDMGILTQANVFNGDPTTLGSITFGVRNGMRDPSLLSSIIPRIRNGSNTSGSTQANAQPKPGWFFVTKHVSDYTPTAATIGQYDFIAAFNAGGFPASQKINIDMVAANTNGIPTVILECDDSLVGQTSALKDDLAAASTAAGLTTPLRATLYVAPNNLGKGPGNSVIADVRACRDIGWGISCDGRMDDSIMTTAVSVEGAMNDALGLNKVRQFLIDNTLTDGKGGENHLCYPNGTTWGLADGSRVPNSPVAAATSDGATPSTLTFGAAPTRAVAVGDVYYGFGPTGQTVAAVNGSAGTSVTLTGTVPAGTYKVLFQDESGPFQFSEMPERAQTEGFLSGRISGGEPQGNLSRYGVADQAMYLTTVSIAGFTFAQIKSYIDAAMKLGTTVRLLIHGYNNGAYLNVDRTVAQQVWAYVAPLVAAGQLTWPTSAEWWARDCANPLPLPGNTYALVRPAKPTVTATPGSNKVTIAFTDGSAGSAQITTHNIYRGTGNTTPKFLVNVQTTAPYVDTTAVAGTTYVYQVAGISQDGTGVRSSPVSATPTA